MRNRAVFLTCLAVLLAFDVASAERELVDRVVAVVEEEAIFQSDIVQMMKQILVQRGNTEVSAEEREALSRRALDELISSKLIVAQAHRLGIQVSFKDIESRVEQSIAENKRVLGGEAAFQKQMESEGLTEDALKNLYREQIRNRMLVDRVLRTEIDRGTLQITEEDIKAAYETRKGAMPLRPAVVRLSTIYFAFESSSGAQALAKTRVDEVRRRIVQGEDFGRVAEEVSEDPSAKNGGKLGTVKLDDLSDRKFAEAAAVLAVGEMSEPVLTSFGYHLIEVTGADSTTQTVDLRHILIRVRAQEDDIQGLFDDATKVHEDIVAGAPFDSMATAHSDDEPTAAAGGDLGWLRLEDLPQFFRDVLEEMNVGDLSPVLREPTGFRIVKLLESEAPRPFEYDEVREELKKMLEQERMSSTYEGYVAGLRAQFFVEVRDQ